MELTARHCGDAGATVVAEVDHDRGVVCKKGRTSGETRGDVLNTAQETWPQSRVLEGDSGTSVSAAAAPADKAELYRVLELEVRYHPTNGARSLA